MMKQVLAATVLALGTSASAQVAPDFNVTDLNNNAINLYSWLNAGKVVIVDASATWCGPCWSLHQSHALEYLYENFGPDGTDQIRVLFYEADAQTTLADLQGQTGGTQGDWLTGTSYPVVNEAPLTLSAGIWWPLGFPTVSLIRPSDKMIVEDMWNWNYNQMYNAINQIITLNSAASVTEVSTTESLRLFPVPVTDMLTVDMTGSEMPVNNVVITDATGRVVDTRAVGADKTLVLDVRSYDEGVYFVSMVSDGITVATKQFVK